MTTRQRMTLVTSILGSSMATIDGSVVNVALPSIQKALSASTASALWVVNGYLLALGSAVLVGGALGDRYGRRRCFVIGLAVFTLASLACGLAPSALMLVLARAAQGAGAALMTPASLALLAAGFEGEARGKAIGTWAAFGALAAALGPVVGGWLVDHVTWRVIFLMNLPVGIAAAVCALAFVDESHGRRAKRVDVLGCATAITSLGALTWGLTAEPDLGWSDPRVYIACVAGLVLAAGFVVIEHRRGDEAMLPLSVFRVQAFAMTNALTFLLYAALGGVLFFLPFALIRVGHYPAAKAGASLLPLSVLMFFGSGLSGRLSVRFGVRLPLTVGPLVTGAGFVWLAFARFDGAYLTQIFPAALLLAIGLTATVAPLTTTVMSALEDERSGIASGVNNAVARVGGLLAIAAFGVVLASAFAYASNGGHEALSAALAGDRSDPALAFALRAVMLTGAALAVLSSMFGGLTRAVAKKPQDATSPRARR